MGLGQTSSTLFAFAHLNIDSDAIASHLNHRTNCSHSEPTFLNNVETMETGEEFECPTTGLFSELPSSKVIVDILNTTFDISWQLNMM